MKIKITQLPIIDAIYSVIFIGIVVWVYHITVIQQQGYDDWAKRESFHLEKDIQQIQQYLNQGNIDDAKSLVSVISESDVIADIFVLSSNYDIVIANKIKFEDNHISNALPKLYVELLKIENSNLQDAKKLSKNRYIYPVHLLKSGFYNDIAYVYVEYDFSKLIEKSDHTAYSYFLIFVGSTLVLSLVFGLYQRRLLNMRLQSIESRLVKYTDGDRLIRFEAKPYSDFEKLELLLNAMLDLTEHETEQLRLERDYSELILNLTNDGILAIDRKGKIIRVNKRAAQVFGYSQQQIMELTLFDLVPQQHHATHDLNITDMPINSIAPHHKIMNKVRRVSGLHSDGHLIPLAITISYSEMDGEKVYIASFTDLTEKVKYENSIEQLAYYDPLTSLLNVVGIRRQLEEFDGQKLNFILMELVELRAINDSFGYDFGDEFLKHFATRLNKLPLDNVITAKATGGRFIVTTTSDSQQVLTELHSLKSMSCDIQGRIQAFNFACSTSVLPSTQEFDVTYRNCRVLLRHSTHDAEQWFQEVNVEWINEQISRAKLQQQLRLALENEELYFDYQPRFDAKTKKVSSTEALIRWKLDGKDISPREFIPIAENNYLMLIMDKFVIRSACRQLRAWINSGMTVFPVSINLSSKYLFQESTIAFIFENLGEFNVPAELLEIEITESGLTSFDKITQENMKRLQLAGIKIAIDDYGIGRSNLITVASLPIQHLKIDQAFIKQSIESEKSRAVFKNIIYLAKSLDIELTAKGVETQQQFDHISELGCHAVQGFFLSKPLIKSKYESDILHQG